MRTNRWKRLLGAVLLSGIVLGMSASQALALQVGDKAPDFSSAGDHRRSNKARRLRGEKAGGAVFLHRCFYQRLEPRKRWPFNLISPSLRPSMPRFWA